MPHRDYPPASLRYLKARLLNLGQPSFWVTAIFLSIVGLVTWEYWSNPDIFVYKQKKQVASQTPADSSLSEENRAIAADIDNLPVLFNDFEQASLSATANSPKEKTEEKNSKGLLEDVIKKQKSDTDPKLNPASGVKGDTPPTLKNPFVVQTENLLRNGTVDSNNQFLGFKTLTAPSETTGEEQTSSSLGIGFTNQTTKNQNSVSINPLQAALNQSTNQKLSGLNGNASVPKTLGQVSDSGTTLMPPTNSLPSQNSLPITGLTPGTGYTSTGTNLQPNPSNNLNNSQVLPNVAPVTPPVTYTAPNNISPYSSQIPNQGVVIPINGNYGLQQPTQLPQSNYGNYGLQQPTQPSQSNFVQQQPTQSNSLYLRQLRDKYRSPSQN